MKMAEISGRKESILARHELVTLVAVARPNVPPLIAAQVGEWSEKYAVFAYIARATLLDLERAGLVETTLDPLRPPRERFAFRVTEAGRAAIDRTQRYHESMVAICQESK